MTDIAQGNGVSASTPPRPSHSLRFTLRAPQRRKRGPGGEGEEADLLRAVKLAKQDPSPLPPPSSPPSSSSSYRPPPPSVLQLHAAERERLKAEYARERERERTPAPSPPAPGSASGGEAMGRAQRLLLGGDAGRLLSAAELVWYWNENERAKMQQRYGVLFARRQREKEVAQAYKEKGKDTAPPSLLLLHPPPASVR